MSVRVVYDNLNYEEGQETTTDIGQLPPSWQVYMWGSTKLISIYIYLYDMLLTSSLNAKPKGEITNVIIDDRSFGCDASVRIQVKGRINNA